MSLEELKAFYRKVTVEYKEHEGLVLIHCLVKDFLDGSVNKCLFTVENFLNERLLVLCVELVYPSCEDGEQQDDGNHDEC